MKPLPAIPMSDKIFWDWVARHLANFEIVSAIPTVDTLKKGDTVLYESGTARRLYFNIGGIIYFITIDDGDMVLSDSIITDHSIVRGDGGARNVQDSGIIVDDSDNVSGVGDLTFANGGGLLFGSVWGNEIAWTQASAVQDTWYEISDDSMSDGQLNGVAHDGSGKFTIATAGMYLCNYTISGETNAGAGTHIQTTFSISGTETNDGMNHSETRGANAQIAIAGTAILDLAAGATLEISIRTTDAGTPNITVDHLNISIAQIGGT